MAGIDKWLLKYCKLDFVLDRINEQYNTGDSITYHYEEEVNND